MAHRTFLTCCIIDPFHCFEGVKFFSRKSRVRPPGLKLNIPASVFCMSWCPDFEFRVTQVLTIEERAAFTSAEDEEDDDEERVVSHRRPRRPTVVTFAISILSRFVSISSDSYLLEIAGRQFFGVVQDEEEDPHFSDHFDYTKNYAESLALFSSMSYYAIMHPTILPCAAVYFYTKYAIDKYQITQQYTRARIQFR